MVAVFRSIGVLLLVAVCAISLATPASAAPARLNDDIPDAVPDAEGMWSFSYGYQNIGLDGPLTGASSTHNFYKLRYAFSNDAEGSVYYNTHSLAGGSGLLTPLFNNQDSATGMGVDLRLNLLDEASHYDKPDDPKSFVAGSAFDIGVGLDRLSLSTGTVDQDDSLMRAYLAYSTDLSSQLRAHTYFSTGRISGDTHTGSTNRIAAGLDYQLTRGRHPLTLMADAILDVYNFRQPTFDTSRITSFDIGMRYGLSDNLYGNLGWMTYNDSASDDSGSGIFAGLQWISASPRKCEPSPSQCTTPPPASVTAPAAAAPAPAPDVAVATPPATAPSVVDTAPPAPAPAAPQPEPAPVAETPTPAPAPAETTPAPAPVAPPAATPPADKVLVLPDGRADAPLRQRVVASLSDEFSSAPLPAEEAARLAGTDPADERAGYDPHSWEDAAKAADSTPSSPPAATGDRPAADDNGVQVPQLDLFPQKLEANAGDSRPELKPKERAGKSASTAKERPLPKEDPNDVEVDIAPAPVDDAK